MTSSPPHQKLPFHQKLLLPTLTSVSLQKGGKEKGGGVAKAVDGGPPFIVEIIHPNNDAWQCQLWPTRWMLGISRVIISNPTPLTLTSELGTYAQMSKHACHMAHQEWTITMATSKCHLNHPHPHDKCQWEMVKITLPCSALSLARSYNH